MGTTNRYIAAITMPCYPTRLSNEQRFEGLLLEVPQASQEHEKNNNSRAMATMPITVLSCKRYHIRTDGRLVLTWRHLGLHAYNKAPCGDALAGDHGKMQLINQHCPVEGDGGRIPSDNMAFLLLGLIVICSLNCGEEGHEHARIHGNGIKSP